MLREAIAAELRAGRSPGALLADAPTLSERMVREVAEAMAQARAPRRGHLLGFSL